MPGDEKAAAAVGRPPPVGEEGNASGRAAGSLRVAAKQVMGGLKLAGVTLNGEHSGAHEHLMHKMLNRRRMMGMSQETARGLGASAPQAVSAPGKGAKQGGFELDFGDDEGGGGSSRSGRGQNGGDGGVGEEEEADPHVSVLPDDDDFDWDLLGPSGSPRRRVGKVLWNWRTQGFIFFVILLNLGFMAAELPPGENEQWFETTFLVINVFATVVFTVEMVLAVYCLGLYKRPHSYLRNSFNVLDMLIVISAYVEFLMMAFPAEEAGAPNLSFLRVFRVARALRAVRSLSGLRLIAESTTVAIPRMRDVLIYLLFFLYIMGLSAVLFWKGSFRYRCADDTTGAVALPETICNPEADGSVALAESGIFCARDHPLAAGAATNGTTLVCANVGYNPHPEYVAFDNMYMSLLVMFIVTSLEGWTDIMYATMDAGFYLSPLLYIITVFLATFVLLDLSSGIIVDSFGVVRAERRALTLRESGVLGVIGDAMEREAIMAEQEQEKQRSEYIAELRSKSRVFEVLNDLVTSPYFEYSIMAVIMANTVCLAYQHYGMSAADVHALNVAELVFLVIYTLEVVLKVAGLGGPRMYAKDWSNVFDAVLVVLGILSAFGTSDVLGDFLLFRVLRLFKVFRLLRLTQKNEAMKQLINTALGSFGPIGNILLFSCLLTMCFAILCMQLYAGALEEGLRLNFDTFWEANLTLFTVVTGENWTDVLHACIAATRNAWMGPIVIILFFLLAYLIMLNLFVAVILENFELADEIKLMRQEYLFEARLAEELGMTIEEFRRADDRQDIYQMMADVKKGKSAGAEVHVDVDAIALAKSTSADNLKGEAQRTPSQRRLAKGKLRKAGRWARRQPSRADVTKEMRDMEFTEALAAVEESEFDKGGRRVRSLEDLVSESESEGESDGGYLRVSSRKIRLGPCPRVPGCLAISMKLAQLYRRDRAFFFLGKENALRNILSSISKSQQFDSFIFACIVGSCLLLAWESSYAGGPPDVLVGLLGALNTLFLVIFAAEALMKSIEKGFVLNKGAYLRNGWNVVDFLVLVMSLVSVLLGYFVNDTSLLSKAVAFRAFRPLRFLNRFEGMKVTLKATWRAIPGAMVAMLLVFLVVVIFSIMGLSLYSGTFYSCTDESVRTIEECAGDFIVDAATNATATREWVNPEFGSFDNFWSSLHLLMQVATLEGYIPVLHATMDAVGVGVAPETDHAPWNALFICSYIFVVTFFGLSMFVGVFVYSYQQSDGSGLVTEEQRHWMEMKKVFDSIRPTRSLKPEPGSFRELCYNLVVPCHRNPTACGREHHEVHSKFESVMTTIIVLNVLVISLTHYGQSQEYEAWIEGLNVFFLCLYTLEMAAKIIALTTHTYLNSLWNMFDGFLVFAGWLSLIVSSVAPDFNSSFLLLLRALRLLRGLQLIRRVRGLRVLTEALVSSIPALANVSGLLLLMFFIYAIFGVSLFGHVLVEADTEEGRSTVHRWANFRTFDKALLMLFRCCTGENWNEVMLYLAQYEPFWSPFYFYSFMLLVTYMFFNLFLAVLVSTFGSASRKDQFKVLDSRDLAKFRHIWSELVAGGSDLMPFYRLKTVLKALGEPFVSLPIKFKDMERILYELRIRMDGNIAWGIGMGDLLYALVIRMINKDALTVEECEVRNAAIQYMRAEDAAIRIQRKWLQKKGYNRERLGALYGRMAHQGGGGLSGIAMSMNGPQSPGRGSAEFAGGSSRSDLLKTDALIFQALVSAYEEGGKNTRYAKKLDAETKDRLNGLGTVVKSGKMEKSGLTLHDYLSDMRSGARRGGIFDPLSIEEWLLTKAGKQE